MVSNRIFSSVAHDVAHHAQSALSWLHPHLGDACKNAGMFEVSLDLLSGKPYPNWLVVSEPLRSATEALQHKFKVMVAGRGLNLDSLNSAVLKFLFLPSTDSYSCVVKSELVLINGRVYSRTI